MAVLEKKLETINKEADDRLDKLQQKLDDANMLLKKKDKYVLIESDDVE